MLTMTKRHWIGVFAVCLIAAGAAQAEPVKLRIGYGTAAEEQLWLLIAKPDIGKHYGTAYTIEGTRFTGSDKRAQAFEAGAIDIAASSGNGVIFAASEGVKAKVIASLTRESQRGYSTAFYANASAPIKTVKDLKGKTVAVNGFSTSGHLWLKVALEKAGLTESAVTIVPISFSSMAESLRSGKIDVGEFPQPFDAMLHKQGGVTRIFNAKDAIPEDEELIVLIGKDEFLKSKSAAIKGLLEDLRVATNFYLQKSKEARQILLDTKMVRVPADVFLDMNDYYRDPTMRVDLATLDRMQTFQIKVGFQQKAADMKELVDTSYLPQ